MVCHSVVRRVIYCSSGWRFYGKKFFGSILGLCLLVQAGIFSEAASVPLPRELNLPDYLKLVAEHNESVQAQMIETEVSHRKARGETGIFEPNLVMSVEREYNKRLNNSLQQSEQGGLLIYREKNNIYDTGLETLVPTGAKIRLGYTLSDLSNNLTNNVNIFNIASTGLRQQYQTFVGATITQPLLKNAGVSVTMAGIRLAAMESDIAFQQYRRQLMLAISQAEAAYWNLYFAQEQLRYFDESLAVAESILSDSKERLKAGQAAELDVLEAQSGLALRKTKQNDARQNYYDALGRVRVLFGAAPDENAPTIKVVDRPTTVKLPLEYYQRFQDAFQNNPEYLVQQKRVEQEGLRLGYARNQLLPEVNFKGAVGYNGLGISPSTSWNTVESQDYPSWSLGVEMHIPLGANIKGRHMFGAAKLSLQEAIVNLNSLQTQIGNALHTAIYKARNSQDSVSSYETVVHFNEDLLKTQLARLNVGKIEPRKVLEVEADLFEARQSLVESLVRYRRTLLELQLADGTLLRGRDLDVTRDDLRRRTLALLKDRGLPTSSFQPIPNLPGNTSNN